MRDEEFKHHWRSLPALYAIINIDEHTNPAVFAGELIKAGILLIQLRNKTLSERQFEQHAAEILSLRRELNPAAKIIINDSIPLAAGIAADGVHLGQGDSDPRLARNSLGPNAIIGMSTHCEEQLCAAPAEILSYLAIGPIFHSQTKSGHAAVVGTEELRRLCRLSPKPVVAIGGIALENAAEVFAAGAWSVAMIASLRTGKPSSLNEQLSSYRESALHSLGDRSKQWLGNA